jgi:hypothetical protein
MTEEEAQEMLAKLVQHYKQPVMPVQKYCAALETWASIMTDMEDTPSRMRPSDKLYYDAIHRLQIDISKSYLLFRLIYLQEPLRTEVCSIHRGEWNGQAQCAFGCVYGCDGSGFLKTPEMIDKWCSNIRKNFSMVDDDLISILSDKDNIPKRMEDKYFKFRAYWEWAHHIGRDDLIPEEEKY